MHTYVSLTFRFRQLLGYFKEGEETLPEAQREPYIARCLKCIEKHHDRYPGKKILVTSDSSTFLTRVVKDERISEYTYLIPGKVVILDSHQTQANLHEVICRLLYAC